jgi:hypothetical protein
VIKDEPGDALHGGIAIDNEDRFAQLLKRLHQRVVMAENHLVIELAVDPAFDDALDVAEIAHHVAVIERASANFDFRGGVVAVRVLADAVVIEQPMTVTEVDFFRN